ncbi:MAG: homogentisate phytyltransferase [Scytolyngbya sp. HA4215-MV1]|jgi:homogentisate phytyltransferase/homogentisate geranylgeranyltransferase|nr:homogentisate phytyltransferase [Scytolyngbya sp. HA4215-MV1]
MSRLSSKTSAASGSPDRIRAWGHLFPWLSAFWKFSRPHTIIGTSLSVTGVFLIALAETRSLASPSFSCLIPTLFACLCGNVYIVGLNQIEDVAIDRINKPHLPLASGEFSKHQAWTIVAITGALALLIAFWQGKFLLATVGISLMIGTAYSLPPIRLKRFPLWASLCIFTVRGAIVNLGLFLHFHNGLPILPQVWALTAFILVFTFAIAIFKDMPDTEGDRQYNITTLTLTLGQQAVFNLSRWVLTSCYLGMGLASIWLSPAVNLPFLVTTHLLLLGVLGLRSLRVNLQSQTAIADFYQFIWKLFFLEYLLFPIACLLGGRV